MLDPLNPLYLTVALLAGCFLATMYVARKFQREVAEDSTPITPGEVYGPLERAYFAGLMHEEEYRRIRQQKADEIAATAGPAVVAKKKKSEGPDNDWSEWDPVTG